MTKKPVFSVITTTRNCQEDIVVTAKSIRSQTFRSLEWIIQDCVSTDHTLEFAEKIFPDVKIASTPDDGIYDAMNKATGRCLGNWILFLQAGDWLAGRDVLRIIDSQLLRETEIGFAPVFEVSIEGHISLRQPSFASQKLKRLKAAGLTELQPHFLENMPCHQGVLMRRELFDDLKFDSSFIVSADWHHLFRAVAMGCREQLLHTPLSWYPNGGFSFENSDLWIKDVIRICKEYTQASLVDAHFEEALRYHVNFQQQRHHHLEVARRFIQGFDFVMAQKG